MALDSLIRKGVAIASKAFDSIKVTTYHKQWRRQLTGFGEEQWERQTGVKLRGIWEPKAQKLKLRDGTVLDVEGTLTILDPVEPLGAPDRDEPIDPKDLFVIDGRTFRVMHVDKGVADPNSMQGFLHVVKLG